MTSLVINREPNVMQSNFGDILGYEIGQLEPGGPPAVKIEWPATPQGRADCRAFVMALFREANHDPR